MNWFFSALLVLLSVLRMVDVIIENEAYGF